MLETNVEICDLCDTFSRQRGNHSWLDTLKYDVLPVTISAFSSLLNDMVIAFSPITESAFVTIQEPLVHLLTPQISSADFRPGCSLGHLSATSDGTSGETVYRNPSPTVRKQGLFSSTIGAAKNITASARSVVAIKRALLTRNLQSAEKQRKEDHTPPVAEVIVEIFSEQIQYPNEGSDFNAGRGLCFRKRKGSRMKCDGINGTAQRKKTKRTLGLQQIRKHERKGRQWAKMFQMLVEYKKKYGDTLVPAIYIINNKDLGKWVAIQRHSFNTNNLSYSRIEMLNSIGFVWSEKKPTKLWMESYHSLIIYNEEHKGSTMMPQHCSRRNRKLEFWARQQRSKFRKKELSALEIDLLESIGFSWDI